ncbi:hypothetical protein CBM2633_U30004 [Cupriavidus taiwanensis]|nr:hypothetical protein CBM2633_U30004 [Cupriavidus taiwanensis]
MVQGKLVDGSLRELFSDWRFHPYGRSVSVFLLRLRERYVSPAVMQSQPLSVPSVLEESFPAYERLDK